MTGPRVVHVREGYDLRARIYDQDDNPLILLERHCVAQVVGDVGGLSVADIGCGTGRHAVPMANAGAIVTGVDFSEAMLAKAVQKPGASAVRFVQHDFALGLPFASATFHCIMCCLVFDHVVDLEALLRETARICRTDGFVGERIRPASPGYQIADYVMPMTQAGLVIDHMSEHAVDADVVAQSQRAKEYLGWPLLMMMRGRP